MAAVKAAAKDVVVVAGAMKRHAQKDKGVVVAVVVDHVRVNAMSATAKRGHWLPVQMPTATCRLQSL
jgi:hypothetical protein